MAKQFLNNAYSLASSGHTQQLYKDWAGTYDEEIMANGYSSPVRTAEALTKCGAQLDAPMLDIGCGTGFSLNDHTLKNDGYNAEIARLIKAKKVRIRWHDYGDHLPKIDLYSMIMVLERVA